MEILSAPHDEASEDYKTGKHFPLLSFSLNTAYFRSGGMRIIDTPYGEELLRIC
jgi:hypothetical protein